MAGFYVMAVALLGCLLSDEFSTVFGSAGFCITAKCCDTADRGRPGPNARGSGPQTVSPKSRRSHLSATATATIWVHSHLP